MVYCAWDSVNFNIFSDVIVSIMDFLCNCIYYLILLSFRKYRMDMSVFNRFIQVISCLLVGIMLYVGITKIISSV